MSLIERELNQLKESSEEFFDTYINSFQPKMNQFAFNKFRLHFINIITDKLTEFYPSPQQQQCLIHTLQIAFQVWDLIPNETEHKDKLFYFFFMGTCFLCTKLYSPEMTIKLKNWACENNIDIHFSFWAEKLIFKKTLGDLYINYHYDVVNAILNLIIPKDNEDNQNNSNAQTSSDLFETYNNYIETWIQFAIYEYNIYSRFSLYTITLACIHITIEEITPEISQEKEEQIKQMYKQMISKHLKYFNMDVINECKVEILKLFYSEEEKENDEENLNDLSFFSLDTAISSSGFPENSTFENIFSLCSGNISNNIIEMPLEGKGMSFITDENDFKEEETIFINRKRKHYLIDDNKSNFTFLEE